MAADAEPTCDSAAIDFIGQTVWEVLGTLMLVIMLSVLGMMMTMGIASLGDRSEVGCHKGESENCPFSKLHRQNEGGECRMQRTYKNEK
jgi:hypothetical protein